MHKSCLCADLSLFVMFVLFACKASWPVSDIFVTSSNITEIKADSVLFWVQAMDKDATGVPFSLNSTLRRVYFNCFYSTHLPHKVGMQGLLQ